MAMLKALLFAANLVTFANQTLAEQPNHSPPPAVLAQNSLPQQGAPTPQSATSAAAAAMGDMHAPTSFTLRSGIAEGRMVYLGVGSEIDGKVNPMLIVHEGETIQINLINGEGAEHDIVVEQ